MPRPTSKDEPVYAASANYDKLVVLVESIPGGQRETTFNFDDRDQNIRDVLAHLTAWHKMMRRWYDDGMVGRKPAMPSEGYTWQSIPTLNAVIWQDAQQTTLEQALAQLQASHADIMSLIERHTDEELFTKKRYPWTGTTSLGSYLISSTSSHYDWALKKLRKAKKTW
jgi:hypothetical protein